MSRLFDGQFSTESVSFSAGNATFDQGPITIAALVKPATSFSSATCWIISGQVSGSEVWALLTSSGNPFITNDFSTGGPLLTGGNWYWVVVTKASGNVPPRWHIRNVTTAGAWSHSDGPANVGDGSGSSNGIIVGNASAAGGTDWRGNMAALAVWGSQLADLAVEAACTLAASDLAAASPSWGALWNQASTATSVTDFTGGGGNQTAISGTSVDADEPPGWSYSLTASAPIPPPIIRRAPGRIAPGGRWTPWTGVPDTPAAAPAAAGAGTTSQHATTSSDAAKRATGAATAPGRATTAATGRKQATAGTSTHQRGTSSATATKTATGAATAAGRAHTRATAPTPVIGAAITSTRTATTATGRKQTTAGASATIRPVARATAPTPLIGSGAAALRPATSATGRRHAAAGSTITTRPATRGTGTRTATAAGRASAHTAAAAAGAHRAVGAARASTRPTTEATTAPPYTPAHVGLDAATTAGAYDHRTTGSTVDQHTAAGSAESTTVASTMDGATTSSGQLG